LWGGTNALPVTIRTATAKCVSSNGFTRSGKSPGTPADLVGPGNRRWKLRIVRSLGNLDNFRSPSTTFGRRRAVGCVAWQPGRTSERGWGAAESRDGPVPSRGEVVLAAGNRCP
jgi:hypothetical protein